MNTYLKIQFGDSFEDAIIKLSEKNIGAGKALAEISQASQKRPLPADLETEVQNLPEFAKTQEKEIRKGLAEMHPLLALDEAGVHGHLIWMLYKDACGENPNKVCDILDQYKNGEISAEEIHQKVHIREPHRKQPPQTEPSMA